MTVIYFILILGIIIAVHEAGHLLMAKIFGVYVQEFAIGFGPKLFSRKGKETVYSLRAVPLGGFTGMVENETVPTKFDEEGNPIEFLSLPKERTFYGIKIWKRIMILLGGPLFNILLACLAFVLAFQINGSINEYPAPVIYEVQKGSAAEQAGLLKDDLITKMVFKDGTVVIPETFEDIIYAKPNNTEEVTIYVTRQGQELSIRVTPRYDEETKNYMLGISCGPLITRRVGFFEAYPLGIKMAFRVVSLTFEAVVGLFTGASGLDSLGGTISMYRYTEEAASYGLVSLISLMASLSVSVGIMNLVPIPVFDGGKIVFAIIEKIIGHRLSEKVENTVNYIGLGMILLLFVLVTYLDITKLFH